MRRIIATLAVLGLANPAAAEPTPSSAFECKEAYRPTMESAARLSVIKQSETPGNALMRAHTFVQLAPGDTRVFGQTPIAMSLSIFEPGGMAGTPTYSVVFNTDLAYSPDVEKAIMSAVRWEGSCYSAATRCMTKGQGTAAGALEMSRTGAKIELRCTFEVREEDLG